MRNLYYYLGYSIFAKRQEYMKQIITSISKYQNLTPVLLIESNLIHARISLLMFADWGKAEKVVWKKFRDPGIPKYITANFYKMGKGKRISTGRIEDWKIVGGLQFPILNFNQRIIYRTKDITEKELDMLKETALGNFIINPFKQKYKEVLVLND